MRIWAPKHLKLIRDGYIKIFMRHIRIYHPGELSPGITVLLEPDASHHLLQVLRKKISETLWIFNGRCHGEFEATLVSTHKKTACVKIGSFHECKSESCLSIHLGQAISRGERMDYAIQKATELGVNEITPLITEFGQIQLPENRISKKMAHWQAIANSAAEQSGRCTVPIIHPPQLFLNWMTHTHALKIICTPQKQSKLFNTNNAPKNIAIAIGAEGGFSSDEIKQALLSQCIPLSLGPRILRTETATVVALTLLQQRWGDLRA